MMVRGLLCAMLIAGLVLSGPLSAQDGETEKHEEAVELRVEPLLKQGLVVGTVRPRTLNQTIEATAEVAFNETQRAAITARAAGWVEKVSVYAGIHVSKGQLLAEINSPEFLSAQYEYLLILDRVKREQEKEGQPESQALLAAAASRLRVLGLNDDEVRTLEETRESFPVQHIHSPIDGTVVSHQVNSGDAVEPGQALFVVAALNTVWADIDLTEARLGKVSAGQPVRLTVEAYPKRVFHGEILSLGAAVQEESRTVKARALIKNAERLLKPGMFARARIDIGSGGRDLMIPDEAVVLLQGKTTVFKVEGDRLEPQAVELGGGAGGWRSVKAGLRAGDRIAVKGAYLLKSLLLKSQIGDEH